MSKALVFLSLFMMVLSSHAEVFRRISVPAQGQLDRRQGLEISSLMACQIEENFDEYVQHIVEYILPRVDFEVSSVLLRPHISIDGERVQVAEEVDSADLFHVHVRVPTPPMHFHPVPFEAYLDPQFYHLQYHSFERSDAMTSKWREELSKIDDPLLTAWLRDVEEHVYLQSQLQDPGLGDYSGVNLTIDSPLEAPLSEGQVERFSNLWYDYLNSNIRHTEEFKDWLLARLKTRLNFVDPETIAFDNVFAHSRSVVSSNREFLLLNRLNIPDHAQFANIYFEDRSDMSSEILQIIEDSESQGLDKLVRGSEAFDQMLLELRNIDDNLNALKYAHLSSVSSSKHEVISWTENFVFSVSFSLNCEGAL